jgi:thioredoxin-related protein
MDNKVFLERDHMKTWTIVVAVLAMGAPSLAADWQKDFKKTFAEARAAAQAADKPMYLHFTTTWCHWCRQIEKDDYSSDEGRKALEPFVCATLDCTVLTGQPGAEAKINLDLMKRFAVSGYPSLVMVTADGAFLHSWSGYMPVAAFARELEKPLKVLQEYKDFVKELAKGDKTTYEHNLKAMNGYAKFQKWDSAAEAAQVIRKLDAKDEKGDAAMAAYVQYKAARAANASGDKIKAALEEVKKFDPKNEKGLLETGMWDYATAYFDVQQYKETVAILSDLIGKASKLKDAQRTYGLLGQSQMQLGDRKAAQASIEKAIAEDPKSPMVTRLQGLLDRIKSGGGAR